MNQTPRDADEFGPQGLTEADTAYAGSTFRELREALFANPYYEVWDRNAALPTYPVTLGGVLRGILPFGKRYRFLQAAKRTIDSNADLRWGPDGKGFRRILHPNGVCLTGRWEITADNDYSGYFKTNSRAQVVARYSTCCAETRRGHNRSLSLVGKIYPSEDPNDTTPYTPASFITQQDLGGENTPYINDAELRNAPDTRAWRRGLGLPILLVTGLVFLRADRQPSERQTYEIAELAIDPNETTRAPRFMRLLVDEKQARIDGEGLDFRHEIMAQIYDPGIAVPQRELIFHIEVSDEGESRGLPVFERRSIRNWRRIGRMVFNEAVVSYNGDRVIHFNHPAWRNDRNDPASVATRR